MMLPVSGLYIISGMMINEYGAIGGMKIGRRNTLRKPVSVPLCPPQIPHDSTWATDCLINSSMNVLQIYQFAAVFCCSHNVSPSRHILSLSCITASPSF
jgi:hypothetical protein